MISTYVLNPDKEVAEGLGVITASRTGEKLFVEATVLS